MSRNESLYFVDIQESCEKVMRFTKGMTIKTLSTMTCTLMLSSETWKLSAKP